MTDAGPTALPIDRPASRWLCDMKGYQSWPGYLDFHRLSMNGMRIFGINGEAYDSEAAAETARSQAASFLDSVASRLAEYRERTGEVGTLVFAVDCELLGHWWTEGPQWLEAVLAGAADAGVGLRRLDRNRSGPVRQAELKSGTWGEDKDFHTWDSSPVADMAWGARQLELRVINEVASGASQWSAERAVREMLGAQASDWAFLDGRRQAGDYAFERALQHSGAAYEALDSPVDVLEDSRMRSLAPDLDSAPLLEP